VFRLCSWRPDRLDLGFEDLTTSSSQSNACSPAGSQSSVKLRRDLAQVCAPASARCTRSDADALQDPEPRPGELTLRRILETCRLVRVESSTTPDHGILNKRPEALTPAQPTRSRTRTATAQALHEVAHERA